MTPKKFEVEIRKVVDKVNYSVTNESIDAVIKGLNLKSNDSVLAVAGSGDHAFAMLEYAGEVKVIDSNPFQIDLVMLRAELLRIGRYDLFFTKRSTVPLNDDKIVARKNYFSKEDLMRKDGKLRPLKLLNGKTFQSNGSFRRTSGEVLR